MQISQMLIQKPIRLYLILDYLVLNYEFQYNRFQNFWLLLFYKNIQKTYLRVKLLFVHF